MYPASSTVNLRSSTFEANSAYYGGGICTGSYADVNLISSTFLSNTADYGVGIYAQSYSAVWVNNTVFHGSYQRTAAPGTNTDQDIFSEGTSRTDCSEDIYSPFAPSPQPTITPTTEPCVVGGFSSSQKNSRSYGSLPDTVAISSGDMFGHSLASIGDLDRDGVMDMAVGAHQDDESGYQSGSAYITFMNTDGTIKSAQKINNYYGNFSKAGYWLDSYDWFGIRVAYLSDLDGDGSGDIAVGAHGDDDGGSETGAVYIIMLSTDGLARHVQKINYGYGGLVYNGATPLSSSDYFGYVGTVGDLDGDGLMDIGVGAYGDDDGG